MKTLAALWATVAIAVGMSPPAAAQLAWTMPELAGRDLQFAQETIQLLAPEKLWSTGSIDATGQGRLQFQDKDWLVCSSTPPAGATFTPDTNIIFHVVRIDGESCPEQSQ